MVENSVRIRLDGLTNLMNLMTVETITWGVTPWMPKHGSAVSDRTRKKQIDECITSGKPVRVWCEENALAPKTYYYRLKRVREFACQALEVTGWQNQVKKADETIFAEVRLKQPRRR